MDHSQCKGSHWLHGMLAVVLQILFDLSFAILSLFCLFVVKEYETFNMCKYVFILQKGKNIFFV